MLRTPRSLNVHAIVDPTGDAIKLSGVGRLRTCSTVNGDGAGVWALPIAPAAAATSAVEIRTKATLRLRIVGELYAAHPKPPTARSTTQCRRVDRSTASRTAMPAARRPLRRRRDPAAAPRRPDEPAWPIQCAACRL